MNIYVYLREYSRFRAQIANIYINIYVNICDLGKNREYLREYLRKYLRLVTNRKYWRKYWHEYYLRFRAKSINIYLTIHVNTYVQCPFRATIHSRGVWTGLYSLNGLIVFTLSPSWTSAVFFPVVGLTVANFLPLTESTNSLLMKICHAKKKKYFSYTDSVHSGCWQILVPPLLTSINQRSMFNKTTSMTCGTVQLRIAWHVSWPVCAMWLMEIII